MRLRLLNNLGRKYVMPLLLVLSLLSAAVAGCTTTQQTITFSQLISQADKYNGKTVIFEAFYFSGFEISALSESVGPSTSGVWRIVPTGTLIWVKSGITQELVSKLYTQTQTPSGYSEHIGRLKVTGVFETGAKYGHLDAYQYQLAITNAESLEWTPPPAASTPPTGNLQIKVTDLTGKPLESVKVVSEEQPEGQLKVSGLTDASGTVTFNDIKSGDYRFYVSHADYVQTELTVTVIGGQTTSEAVSMTPTNIPTSPQAGEYLYYDNQLSAGMILKSVAVTADILDKDYMDLPGKTQARKGELCWVISGVVESQLDEDKYMTLTARGYDADGKEVSYVLDAGPIWGVISLFLPANGSDDFALHLKMSPEVVRFELMPSKEVYDIPPP